MRIWTVALTLVFNVAAFAESSEARENPHRSGEQARFHAQDAGLHRMQQMRRKHDLRRPYHDRRPRRPMRSM